MDLDRLREILRFPFVHEGVFHDSELIEQNKYCISKCVHKECLRVMNLATDTTDFKCSHNYDCFIYVSSQNEKFMYNGLKLDESSSIAQKTRKAKSRVSKKELEFELARVKSIETVLDNITGDKNPQFSILHDIKTTFGLIQSQADLLINREPGNNFEEKLNNANYQLKDLYDSLAVVNSQLGMIDILVNPSKITHGLKRSLNLYQLFERMSKLFRARANRKNITINWEADSIVPNAMFYDAIEFMPLVLLDNAIKYSKRDRGIKVFFNSIPNHIEIKCSSFGRFIDDDEKDIIFQKFKRGKNVSSNSEGMGIGLWILKQIIEAHNGDLYYEKEGTGLVGANNFIVRLKINAD